MTIAKTICDDGQCSPSVLEGFATRQERMQDIDEDDLSRIMPEMILVEPGHGFTLVHLETLRHERAERVRRKDIPADFHGRKPKERRFGKSTSAQKPAGLQIGEAVLVARLEQKRAIEVVRLLRNFIACGLIRAMARHEGKKIPANLGTCPLPHYVQCGARPIAKALLEEGQIKQPFAGVIYDFKRHFCR